MNKKTIAAFLGGIALTAAVFTTAPVVRDAVTPKVDAAGTCPITLQPIQSTGNLVFSPFSFYSSDLTNLRAELNDLGAWADGEISSIQSDVSNGKSSLRDKMVSRGASSSLPTVPSFAQLKDAVDDIWNSGIQYQKEHTNTKTTARCNISPNADASGEDDEWHSTDKGSMDYTYNISHNGTVRIIWSLDGDDGSVKHNGSSIGSGSGNVVITCHSGDTLSFYQKSAGRVDPPSSGYIIITEVW